jgi:uncharacterized protein (DUF1501 family)
MNDTRLPLPLGRRRFAKQACCAAIGATGCLNALAQLRTVAAAASTSGDFKALVCLFLGGGNDATNLLIPYDTVSYNGYSQARAEVAIPRSSLLPIAPSRYNDGRSWALHPSAPELQSLFAQGKVAFLANVGTLVQPTTLAGYNSGQALPPQLFSHIDQSTQWQSSIPDQPFTTGWGGRLADLIGSLNANPRVSMSISVAGTNAFQRGNSVTELVVADSNFPLGVLYSAFGTQSPIFGAISAMYADANPNLLQTAFAGMFRATQSDAQTLGAVLPTAPVLKTVFPSSDAGSQLATVAKLISVAAPLGLRRQIFFVQVGGWDLHANQTSAHGPLLSEISSALSAFYNATVELGVGNQVTTFTASDFGRTYIPNAGGTDHGWGNHQIVMGGAVNGGDIYGQMPTLALGGPDDAGRGRWIPSTSVDEYSATLATWFGVSSANLPTVLPNIGRFAHPNLGFIPSA